MRSTLPSMITDRNYTIQMVSEGLYSLGGRGISEPDTVLWDLKCRNTGRWDGAVWDRTANYTLARHITLTRHIHVGIFCLWVQIHRATDFCSSGWDNWRIIKKGWFTQFYLNGFKYIYMNYLQTGRNAKLSEQFEPQETCCLVCLLREVQIYRR